MINFFAINFLCFRSNVGAREAKVRVLQARVVGGLSREGVLQTTRGKDLKIFSKVSSVA